MVEIGRPPAPGRLAIVQDFANEAFPKAEAAGSAKRREAVSAWLRASGLGSTASATNADIERLLELRHFIRRAIEANHARDRMPPATARRLNALLAAGTMRAEITADGNAQLVAATGGVDGIIATFAAIIVEASQSGAWERMQLCRADACRWAFYDHSKNRSGVWCSMADCGNRAKARAFRERQQPGERKRVSMKGGA